MVRLEAKIETNREKDREHLKEMRKEIISGQAEMRFTLCAMRPKLETIQHRMKVVLQPIRTELDETTICNGATETKPDPRMTQSVEEHQEAPKEDDAVMLFEGPRKRRRVCNLAAKRCQKRKERTRGNRGYRRKLSAVACRNVFCRVKMAWQKRKLVRRIETQINYGPRKRLTVTGRKMTSPSKMEKEKAGGAVAGKVEAQAPNDRVSE
jgi:GH24 family phage-related lysozyme (muramidase)